MSTREFLGSKDFVGGYKPAPKGPVEIGGESTFDGALLFFNLPSGDVKQVIPEDFPLACKQNRRAPDVHPVILFMGHHSNLRWIIPGVQQPPGSSDYYELVLLVPFVRYKSEQNWHSFAVRMYLDNDFALWVGNTYYGYAKDDARNDLKVEQGAPSSFKTVKQNLEYFAAALRFSGEWHESAAAEQSVPNYRAMQEIVSMPVLGYNVFQQKYVCSYFQWDYSRACVGRMSSCHKFVREFVNGMANWVGHDIESADNGVVALRDIKWRIAWPARECEL